MSMSRPNGGRRARVALAWLAALGTLWPLGGLAQSNFTASFDHFTTGFRLDGAHATTDCESCHVDGVFQGTPRECSACHSLGGRIRATPKPVDHILTTNFCEDCHRTRSWLPLVEMNHDSVFGSCASCHNNVETAGKPPDHLVTQLDCVACHRTTAWLPARFDHSDVTGNCAGCHDGITATGKGADHFLTQIDCGTCHMTTAWTPIEFLHQSATYPGDHGVSLTCTDCHTGNAETIPWPFAAYAPDCAACHANDYRAGEHDGTLSDNRNCGASGCHRVRSRGW